MPSGHKSITDIELLNPGVQIVHKDDKSPRLDIRARSEDGTIHHIEIQLQYRTGMEKRFFYYNCRLVSNQLQSGSDYSKLKPVISILINDFDKDNQIAPEYHLVKSMWIAKPQSSIAHIKSNDGLEIHLVQLRQLPVFKPENMLNYSREELWGFFLALENEEERRLLSKMGKTYEQANTAWKKVSQDETLRQQQWYLETIRTDYLIDIQTAEERGEERGEKRGVKIGEEIGEERGEKRGIKIGEEIGEERGEKRGVKIGEERAEERKRVQLLDSLLGLCNELQLSLTDDQQHKLQNLSFEKLLELQVHIAIQKILPKDF